MLIKRFSKYDDENSGKLERGIFTSKRTIHLFVPKHLYETKSYTNCKAVIINESALDSSKDFISAIRVPNSIIIRKAVYFGTIITDIPGNFQSHNAFFTLDNVTTTAKTVIPNGNTISYAPNTYSTRFKSIDENDLIMLDVEHEIKSIPPSFYSEYDMYKNLGDWHELGEDTYYDMKTNVRDLIDNFTTIQFNDISKYDTMRLELLGKIVNVENTFRKSIEVPCSLGSAFSSYVGKGTIFIYDSDAFGFNKDGVNAKGGIIPLGEYYNKPWLADNLRNSLDMFRYNCKDIENEYGHIRVLFNPDAIGNKYKIRFKDYKRSPIVPLGSINENGIVDDSKDKSVSGIDNGYSTDRSIQDNINIVKEDNYLSFMKSMQGY